MSANRIPDENNREQLLEYGVLTGTAPDGTKMGATAVALAGSSVAYDATRDAIREARPVLFDQVLNFISLAAGAEVGGFVNTEGFTAVAVMGYGTQTFDMTSTPSPDGGYLMDKETLASAVALNTGVAKKPTIPGPWIYVTVKNTSVAAGNFHLWVSGV